MDFVPMYRNDLATDVLVSPCRPYSVTLRFGGKRHDMHVLAFKSCDAIANALDLLFDGEFEMPDGMQISAHPANVLRAA